MYGIGAFIEPIYYQFFLMALFAIIVTIIADIDISATLASVFILPVYPMGRHSWDLMFYAYWASDVKPNIFGPIIIEVFRVHYIICLHTVRSMQLSNV